VTITIDNFTELVQLCDEFGFTALDADLAAFRASPTFLLHHAEALIRAHEERALRYEEHIARLEQILNAHIALQEQMAQRLAQLEQTVNLQTDTQAQTVERLAVVEQTVDLQTGTQGQMAQRLAQVEQTVHLQADTQAQTGERLAAVEQTVNVQREQQAQTAAEVTKMQPPLERLGSEVVALRNWTNTPDSLIISEFRTFFAEFHNKKWKLLWRGSRNGFGGDIFHELCNGHPNTLTVIKDVGGFIFGGFTPVEWESIDWNRLPAHQNNTWKCDNDLKSFLFTLKNPHNIAPRKFLLRQPQRKAIMCNSTCGPSIYGFVVANDSHLNTNSHSELKLDAGNDTGLDGKIVFTGEEHFRVDEIEVFEITD
jgi:hypothetical protein